MRIICLDLEGVLVPEIWVSLAERTKIKDLFLTTRDIEDYSELMDHRLKVFKREGLKIEDIHKAVNDLEPFDGAKDFLDTLSKDFQVVILSDTFYEIASPLFNKLGNPCHSPRLQFLILYSLSNFPYNILVFIAISSMYVPAFLVI